MTVRLTPGDAAPGFTLAAADGGSVSLSDSLSDSVGMKTIVYFYPAAGTPGCTTQACDFRDHLNSLNTAGYRLLGISPDPVAKLAGFAAAENLNFPLLSDPDHTVAEAWGAWGEKTNYGKTYQGLIRSTFVLDHDGTVLQANYNVRATGHVAKLRRELGID